jgi:hypothetical protein
MKAQGSLAAPTSTVKPLQLGLSSHFFQCIGLLHAEPQTITEIEALDILETKNQKLPAASKEIVEEHSHLHKNYEKILETLNNKGNLKYEDVVNLIKRLGGKVIHAKTGSHGAIWGTIIKKPITTIVNHKKNDKWPGPRTRKDIVKAAEELMRQQLEYLEVKKSNG